MERSRCTSWDDDRGDHVGDGGDHVGDDGDHLLDNDGDYEDEDNNHDLHVDISNSAVVRVA